MAEETTPNRDDAQEDEDPPLVIPSRAPLPPPPEVTFVRPTLGRERPAIRPAFSDPRREDQAHLSQGVQGYGLAITAAITLAATLLIFVAIGQWLDHRFNASGVPWFTIAGLLVGIGGGFFNMIRLLSASGRKK